MTHKSHKKAGW